MTTETTWQSMESLVMDGRLVNFKCEGGGYTARALHPIGATKKQKLEIFEKDGLMPDYKKWKQTAWREADKTDLAEGLCPRKL